jgi:hypothetical protein
MWCAWTAPKKSFACGKINNKITLFCGVTWLLTTRLGFILLAANEFIFAGKA